MVAKLYNVKTIVLQSFPNHVLPQTNRIEKNKNNTKEIKVEQKVMKVSISISKYSLKEVKHGRGQRGKQTKA